MANTIRESVALLKTEFDNMTLANIMDRIESLEKEVENLKFENNALKWQLYSEGSLNHLL